MKSTYYFYASLFVSSFFVVGCQRVSDSSSRLKLSVPQTLSFQDKANLQKVTAASTPTGYLMHIAVNVRASDIQIPITYSMDSNTEAATPQPLASQFTIEDLPAGSDRLIQVLAVYMDPNSKIGEFYYGDVTTSLVTGDNSIQISLTLAGSGNVDGSNIAGRYFEAGGNTPTGIVEARIQPPNGKPPMVIERGWMLNGWFSSFMLTNVPLDIVLSPQNLTLFSAAQASSMVFSDNKSLKITIPDHYRDWGTGSRDIRRSESVVMGFFGPGVPAGASVCFDTTAFTYSTMYNASAGGSPITWAASVSGADKVTMEKSATTVSCAANAVSGAYLTDLIFSPSRLNNWGGKEAVHGFSGVFTHPFNSTTSSAPVNVNIFEGSVSFGFKLLPLIAGTHIDSVNVYWRNFKGTRDYESGQSVDCAKISNGGYGFSPLTSIPLVAGTRDYQKSVPTPSGLDNGTVALCPSKNGTPIGGGYVTENFSTSSPTMSANQIKVSLPATKIGYGQCIPLEIELSHSTSSHATTTADQTISLNTNVGSVFSSLANCSAGSPAITATSISAGVLKASLWYRSPSGTSTSGAISVSGSGLTSLNTVSLDISTASSASQLILNKTSTQIAASSCEELGGYFLDANGRLTVPGGSVSLAKYSDTSTSVSDANFDFYPNCSASTVSNAIGFSGTSFNFAVKTTATRPADRLVKVSNGSQYLFVYINTTAQASNLTLSANNSRNLWVGSCAPFSVTAVNTSGGTVATATFPYTLNIYDPSSPGTTIADLKPDLQCTSSTVSNPTLTAGTSNLYILPILPATSAKIAPLSPMLSAPAEQNLTILDVPMRLRSTSSKVHFTSDTAMPSSTLSSSYHWQTPKWGLSGAPGFQSVSTGTDPATQGVPFGPSSSMSFYLASGISGSDEIAATVKFRLSSLSASEVLTLSNSKTSTYSDIFVGAGYTCGTTGTTFGTGGPLKCWGSYAAEALGISSAVGGPDVSVPTPTDLTNATQVAVGVSHTCAINSGQLYCFGNNLSAQIGIGISTSVAVSNPAAIGAGGAFTDVKVGTGHTCAIKSDGAVACWGDNSSKQTAPNLAATMISGLASVNGLSSIVQISLGSNHSCAINNSYTLSCWGDNSNGQLGFVGASPTSPSVISGTYIQVSAGQNHTCAITTTGSVFCWGLNSSGQLGNGSTTSSSSPSPVSGLVNIAQISAGHSHTCALNSTNDIYCWGNGGSGRLGNGALTNQLTPVRMAPFGAWLKVSAGADHTCALGKNLKVYCFGNNSNSQIGDGTTISRTLPNSIDNYDITLSIISTAAGYILKNSAGAVHTSVPVAAATDYTVTLLRGGNNIRTIINGSEFAIGNSQMSVSTPYTSVRIGGNLTGAFKALEVESSSTGLYSGFPTTVEFNYLNQRVP